MDRIVAPNTVPTGSGDTAPVGGTPGQATSGNPASSIPATVFPAYAWNAVQEELIAVIAAASITPDRTSNAQVLAAIRALITAAIGGLVNVPRNYLAGLITSNDGTTPNTKLDIAAGMAADSTNAVLMVSSGALVINCATTGANGLDTGSLANSTWYHAFLIAKADGTVAGLASTSATTPALPSGYSYKRRVGSFKTDGSAHIIAFVQKGDLFQWKVPVLDINTTTLGTTATSFTLGSIPPGFSVTAILAGGYQAASSNVTGWAYDPDTTDTAASTLGGNALGAMGSWASALQDTGPGYMRIQTNASAQIRMVNSDNTNQGTVKLNTVGWIDQLGRAA